MKKYIMKYKQNHCIIINYPSLNHQEILAFYTGIHIIIYSYIHLYISEYLHYIHIHYIFNK